MKSATITDLMSFKALLMLDICLLNNIMNSAELDWFMGTNICLWDRLLVKRLGKFSLILTISLIFKEDAWVYNHPLCVLVFLAGFLPFSLQNLDFSRTFLLGLSRTGGETLEISAFFIDISLWSFWCKLHRNALSEWSIVIISL